MTTPPDPLAAIGFAATHGLDSSQSTDAFLADLRGGEADDQVAPAMTQGERRAYWQAYARTTAEGRTSDELLAEARGESRDVITGDEPKTDVP